MTDFENTPLMPEDDERTVPLPPVFTEDMEILELDSFEVPIPMSDEERERYSRRFLTLFIVPEQTMHRGGSGRVYKVMNAEGEVFAMKRIEHPMRSNLMDDERWARMVAAQEIAFRKEFENQQRLSGLKGFPKLHGYGMVDGEPLIVMEWVEGETCTKAKELRAADPDGRKVPPLSVAKLGITLFDLISRFDYLDDSFAHRDISPNNIMLRTDSLPIAEQVASGVFDVCLIDFGSATLLTPHEDPSFTTVTSVIRKATPEYAPPEMLTNDLPDLDRLRKSALIDVYAISSVLYELLSGWTPYRLAALRSDPASYYRYKLEHGIPQPETLHEHMSADDNLSLQPRLEKVRDELQAETSLEEGGFDGRRFVESVNVTDSQLGHILMKGMRAMQAERAQAWEMKDMLTRFVDNYAENIRRHYRGQAILPFLPVDYVPRRPRQVVPLAAQSQAPVTTVLRPVAAPARTPVSQSRAYPTTTMQGAYAPVNTQQPAMYFPAEPTPAAEPKRSAVRTALGIVCILLALAAGGVASWLLGGQPGTIGIFGGGHVTVIPLVVWIIAMFAPSLIAMPFFWIGSRGGTRVLAGTIALVVLSGVIWYIIHSATWVSGSVEPCASLALAAVALFVAFAAALIVRGRAD